ncbi:hypothetical protein ACQY0O_007533 [Thecaphora frezii]
MVAAVVVVVLGTALAAITAPSQPCHHHHRQLLRLLLASLFLALRRFDVLPSHATTCTPPLARQPSHLGPTPPPAFSPISTGQPRLRLACIPPFSQSLSSFVSLRRLRHCCLPILLLPPLFRRAPMPSHRCPSMSRVLSLLCLLLATALLSTVHAADPPTATPGNTPANTSGNNTNASGSATSTSNSIPSSAAAGGITITNPVQTADPSYYKIASGVSVTFAWNFTSVLQYPSRLTVQAYCSENANTYKIAPTDLPGTATSVVWSPYDYSISAAANPTLPQLIQATYRLQIFDERGRGVGNSPGLMSPNEKVTFALYNPQAYTPLASGWICAACNRAPTLKTINPAILALFATAVVMVASGYGLVMRQL